MRLSGKNISARLVKCTLALSLALAALPYSITAARTTNTVSPVGSETAASHPTIATITRLDANDWIDEGDLGEVHSVTDTVKKGDTLADLLIRAGIDRNQTQSAVEALRSVFNPKKLKIGQSVRVDYVLRDAGSDKRDFVQLSFQASVERDVAVRRHAQSGRYEPAAIARPITRSLARQITTIDNSLFQSGLDNGVPADVMFQMIRNFSYDVDFQRDIQPGDWFDVVYDQVLDPSGKMVASGQLRYASMSLSGESLRIFRFDPADGAVDYFNEKGASVKKALLRTPIDGAKLTSGYGMRQHPLLGYSLMHRGVDFGAATGTPVMAAGDGVIERAGPFAGYGNYVRVRHNQTYSTAYAHLSRYANNIRPGVRVRQGQIVGFVGATGMATGPHLHYEVLVTGTQINPLSVKLPTGRQLDGPDLRKFKTIMAEIDRALERWPDPVAIAAVASLSGDKR